MQMHRESYTVNTQQLFTGLSLGSVTRAKILAKSYNEERLTCH